MRKGELSRTRIDREYPYQIALPQKEVGPRLAEFIGYCSPLTYAPRHFSVFYNAIEYLVFCFAVHDHAEAFSAHWNGLPFNPEDHGRGNLWMQWTPQEPPKRNNER